MWSNEEFEIKQGFDKIENTVKKFNQSKGLIEISQLAQQMYKENVPFINKNGVTVPIWFLAYLAKELLMHTSDTNRIHNITLGDIISLSNYYGKIEDAIVYRDENELRKNFPQIFIKLKWEQLSWQLPIRYLASRNLLIFVETDQPDFRKIPEELNQIFERHIGISIHDFMVISFAISACIRNGGVFREANILNAKLERWADIFVPHKLQCYLAHVCVTNKDFRNIQSKFVINDWREKKYEYNSLRTYPLIRNSANEIIAPISRLLIERGTSGIYYDFMEILKRDNSLNINKYFSLYGDLFDHYVERLLGEVYFKEKNLFKCEDHLPNSFYGKKCDWIIYEDDAVILLECKSTRLILKILQAVQIDIFRDFFRDRYLRDDHFQFTELIRYFTLKGFKRIYPLMVVNDCIPFLNDLTRFFENEQFLEVIESENIQFMGIDELETLIPNLKSIKFSDIIERKLSSLDLRHEPFEVVYNRYEKFDRKSKAALLERIFRRYFRMEEEFEGGDL